MITLHRYEGMLSAITSVNPSQHPCVPFLAVITRNTAALSIVDGSLCINVVDREILISKDPGRIEAAQPVRATIALASARTEPYIVHIDCCLS